MGWTMDHETATRLQTCERYVLGQLSKDERNEFEDHLADCVHCMADVSAADAFAANVNAVFLDRSLARELPTKRRWFDFMRFRPAPALALSGVLNLALLLSVGYAVMRVIPALQTRLATHEIPAFAAVYRLSGNTRGPAPVFTVKSSTAYAIFRFDRPYPYQSYSYVLAGRQTRRAGDLPPYTGAETGNLILPIAGLEPGEYRVRLDGSNGAKAEQIGTCILRVEP